MKYLLLLACLTPIVLKSQSIKLLAKQFGVIKTQDSIELGTGFVMFKSNYIVTCEHVVRNHDSFTYYCGDTGSYAFQNLKVIYINRVEDIAVLESPVPICKPLKAAPTFDIPPKDVIFYLGFRAPASTLKLNIISIDAANVSAVGETTNGSGIAKYFEFNGEGIPGYSGGPIVDTKNYVIGLMDEAFYKRGVEATKARLVNRGIPSLR